jgi:branched-chain amino acid transport system permease protein/urea transport system permease protein
MQALNTVYEILVLAQIVLGLAVVMGMLNVLNIAHGEFVMIGCYTAYIVQQAGAPYIVAMPAAGIVCALIGALTERILIRPLSYNAFETLLATWGLGLLLRKTAESIFGRGYRSVDIPFPGSITVLGIEYPIYRLVLMVFSIAVLSVLLVWYLKSPTAARVRAMVGNKILAEAVGIRTEQLARNTFMVGTAWAGVAGALIAPLTPVEPYMGLSLIVDSFFALVVGGMGTISGLLAGSSVIGGVQSLGAANLDPTWAYLLMLIISIIFLWQKPRGIFPRT